VEAGKDCSEKPGPQQKFESDKKSFIAATPKTFAHQKNKVTFAHELGGT